MRRFILNSLLFVLGVMTAWAQKPDFDLYFANNVTEVADFDEIKSPNSGLRWTKVQTAEGDMSGNYVEVDNIIDMLSSARKKWLADLQQFWTMRDHSLLCFRIDGHGDTSSAYEVSLDNGSGKKLTHTVSDYFFVNLPLQEEPYEVTVHRVGEPEKRYRFRYFIKGWNEAILMMRKGASATVIIPSELGYGAEGKGNILPYSTLIFDIEILNVQ